MRTSTVAVLALAAGQGACWPGMGATLKEVDTTARESELPISTELLGDLIDIPEEEITTTGRNIRTLLSGDTMDPESDEEYYWKPALNSWWCGLDKCCVWQHIADELEDLFRGESGRCTRLARQAVRIAFHDAGAWSKGTAEFGGGADGSIINSNEEMSRPENAAMGDIAEHYERMFNYYHLELGYTEVTMADLLQVGTNVATVVCPLGPRIRTWVGRSDSVAPATHDLLPNPFGDAASIIELFQNKTISPRGLVALLGSHTTSQQHATNLNRTGDPQDSTPGIWDNLYFRQTMGTQKSPERVYHVPADLHLAEHMTTRESFEMYGQYNAQKQWNHDYAREAIRLSLLGVRNINGLTECTKVLPKATHNFRQKDQRMIDRWLSNVDVSSYWGEISRFIEDGSIILDRAQH